MVKTIDVYKLLTRTCDLSRYGTRERHSYPSDRQGVSLSAIPTEICASLWIERLYSSCQFEKRLRLLWRCTEAYDHSVDLARNHRRAPLKSLGVS